MVIAANGLPSMTVPGLRSATTGGNRRHKTPLRTPTIPRYSGVGRNDPCPCGSGKKYKKCCINQLAGMRIVDAEDLASGVGPSLSEVA